MAACGCMAKPIQYCKVKTNKQTKNKQAKTELRILNYKKNKSKLKISNKNTFDCSNTSHSHSIICVLTREPRIIVPVGVMIILPLCCYK